MRSYVVLVCVLAMSTLVLSIPRNRRQIEDTSDWIWNSPQQPPNRPTRPNRPPRPTRPTRPPRPNPNTLPSISVPNQPPTQGSTPSTGPSPAALWRCMQNCLRTPQYDPVCATLQSGTKKTYSNESERMCAEFCGETSTLLFRGNCEGF